ncbi:MAG: 4Fe-4S dicluster domain-containing protein, partial [Defluviitaleaceae bacterium]|nr:4Fe-4S dicluster domain-containing protein [Defluviitaleaceae bacterium]
NQAGKDGVRHASGKGMPVFIMEPLRGGMLVNEMPKTAVEEFARVNKYRSLAEWALAWLLDQPEPTCILSGMSDLNMLEENARAASALNTGCLSEPERKAYTAVLEVLNAAVRVPCTGCNYCMPCPFGVDIPACFSAYNASYTQGYSTALRQYVQTSGAIQKKQCYASMCKRCGKCEPLCPQSIKIADRLDEASRRLESFWFRPLFALARKFMHGGK